MIRRRDPDGYVLISRSEQARLAGFLASAVGGNFAAPSQPDIFAGALLLQGIGFAEIEREWPLDAAGRPADLEDLPLVTRVRAWDAAARAGAQFGPCPEMLCSVLSLRHCTAMAKQCRTMRDAFEVNRLQQREVERQERLRPGLGLRNDVPMASGLPEDSVELNEKESLFDYDVRLALLLEQMAAHICALKAPAVFPALRQRPTSERVTISLRLRNANNVVLDPFPFAEPLEFIVAGRFVSPRIYDHERELHHELRDAPERRLRVTIRP